MNRRGFLSTLGLGLAGAAVPKTFFDMGAAWQRQDSGLFMPMTVDLLPGPADFDCIESALDYYSRLYCVTPGQPLIWGGMLTELAKVTKLVGSYRMKANECHCPRHGIPLVRGGGPLSRRKC
jgi:hypothetical protein